MPVCRCCGDPADNYAWDRAYCDDCFVEIFFGRIPTPPAQQVVGAFPNGRLARDSELRNLGSRNRLISYAITYA